MKFCYIDESGLGAEPFLAMVAVIVDTNRMHKTKEVWSEFLGILSRSCRRPISEFHTRDFYAGNGPWRGIDGPERARIISSILCWWGKRKHHITFTVIDREKYKTMHAKKSLFEGCDSMWRTAAIHISLSVQKAHQGMAKTKGHTLFLFDKEDREEGQFSKFIFSPPSWTDEYYERGKKRTQLDKIVDVPFFGDSQQVLLVQIADLIAFVLRRYCEIEEGKDGPRYKDEVAKLKDWIGLISSRCYPATCRWPSRGLNTAQEMFDKLAPEAAKKIGKEKT